MTLTLPYNECHSSLTAEQNKAALEKVAAIIKINQLRSFGMITDAQAQILLTNE